ncbi:MAG: NusG domain II-containing protein [Clostridia bacterium]|nr:NusG domain II-containing protein [Clostridia bacterium]
MEKQNKTSNQIERFSKSLVFYKKDLILYGLVVLSIVLLFTFLVVIPKTSTPQGFSVSVDEKVVCTFDFSSRELTIDNADFEIVHDKENYSITVYTLDKKGFNVINYDCSNYTVRVTESNCPTHDCIKFLELSSNNGIIYCLPHGLKILPLTPSATEPSTGGRL